MTKCAACMKLHLYLYHYFNTIQIAINVTNYNPKYMLRTPLFELYTFLTPKVSSRKRNIFIFVQILSWTNCRISGVFFGFLFDLISLNIFGNLQFGHFSTCWMFIHIVIMLLFSICFILYAWIALKFHLHFTSLI